MTSHPRSDVPTAFPEITPDMLARQRRNRWLLAGGALSVFVMAAAGWAVWQAREADLVAPEHFAKAVEYRAAGKLRAAVLELKNGLQIRPDDANARAELAQVYLALGDGPSAGKEFRQVIALGRSSSSTELGLLHARLLQGEFEEVLEGLEWLGSDDPKASLIEGEALLALERLDEADSALAEVVDDDALAVRAQQASARVDLLRDELDDARRHIDRAIELSDTDPTSWLVKADVEYAALDFEQARGAAERALAIEENNVPATLMLVESLLRLERAAEADPHITKLEQGLSKAPTVHYLRGIAAAQTGDVERAKRAHQTAISLSPDHRDSLYELAALYYGEQSFAKARETIRQLIEIAPDHVPSRKLLATIQIANGQHDDAIRDLQWAVTERPKNAELASLLSNAYASKGDFDKASRMLTRAARLMPAEDASPSASPLGRFDGEAGSESIRVELLRGAMLVERGQQREAIEIAAAVGQRHPDSPLPAYLMGNAYEALGNVSDATVAYERALGIDPRLTAAVVRLASLELEAGNADAARARLEQGLESSPHHADLLNGMARIARETGDEAQWVRLLDQVREHNPVDIRARLELAEFYLATQPDRALALAGEAVAIDPDAPAAALLMARAEMASGKLESALGRLSSLADANRSSADVQHALGHAQELAGDLSKARDSYSAAVRLDEQHFDARIGLGRLALAEGRPAVASKVAREAQSTHADRAEGYVLEGDAHRLERRPDAAIAAYRAALDRSDDPAIIVSISSTYWAMGDAERARQTLRDRLAASPSDARVRKELAQLGLLEGDVSLAIEQYEHVVSVSPGDFEALNNLAYLFHQGGDDRALELARRAYELAPENLDIVDTYGWILSESGDLEQGPAILRAAVEQAPANPEYRLHLAQALVASGKNSEARDTLIPILKSDGDSAHKREARQLLGLDR